MHLQLLLNFQEMFTIFRRSRLLFLNAFAMLSKAAFQHTCHKNISMGMFLMLRKIFRSSDKAPNGNYTVLTFAEIYG